MFRRGKHRAKPRCRSHLKEIMQLKADLAWYQKYHSLMSDELYHLRLQAGGVSAPGKIDTKGPDPSTVVLSVGMIRDFSKVAQRTS